jgi:hypothetical protein
VARRACSISGPSLADLCGYGMLKYSEKHLSIKRTQFFHQLHDNLIVDEEKHQ